MGSNYDQKPWLKTYPHWLSTKLTVSDHSILDAFLYAASTYPATKSSRGMLKTFSTSIRR